MRVLVAGGGIGGLTTAIALRHQGIEVLVLEQAEVMGEMGGGIQTASSARIAPREPGPTPARPAGGINPQPYDFRDRPPGQILYRAPPGAGPPRRYGAPMYNVHRADLIQLLFD